MNRAPLLTFSHLRWDFVYQRPQHVMSRLARHRPVLFVEEPTLHDGAPGAEVFDAAPGVTVMRPRLPVDGPGFGPRQQVHLLPMLHDALLERGWREFAAWLYTPMAVALACRLGARGIVYDCMDELSAFRGAPPELIECERRLLDCADAVLTGGPSLYEAKKQRHPLVRCFPSSVDAAHFANGAVVPEDQITLRHPRLGYYGVIDERIDLDVVDAVAHAFPHASVVMIGPVVKIDPAGLPRRHNLHYLGQRRYQELPGYVRGWDVCLMPFALNEATRYISPTKVLEYMAASKPIVSTPIADVEGPYREIVYLGQGPDEFVAACRSALEAGLEERSTRAALAARVLERTSWDETAQRMEAILDSVVASARRRPAATLAGVRA